MSQIGNAGVIERFKRRWLYIPVLATSLIVATQPAFATIDNTATANGKYGTQDVNSNPSNTVSIPVVAAAPKLQVTKSVSTVASVNQGTNTSITDAGDTIVYQYVVTNTGNVTIDNVAPVDAGPKFGTAQDTGTGSLGAFSPATATLAPGASQTYTATYTLSQLDVDRSAGQTDAVSNSATATGSPVIGTLATVTASTVTTSITGSPLMTVSKTGALTKLSSNSGPSTDAEVGDTITYTYTVVNTGNVAITDVSITDTHEGTALPAGTVTDETLTSDGPMAPTTASTDVTPDNGIWSTLQPGATITFTYVHTVTQAEVNGG